MFNGIGLIGTLTSSITAYLADKPDQNIASDIDTLTKLKALLDTGALNRAEYDALKAKILHHEN